MPLALWAERAYGGRRGRHGRLPLFFGVAVPPTQRRSPELLAGQLVRAPFILACAAGMWRAWRLSVTGEGLGGEPEALQVAWARLWTAGGAALPDAAGGLHTRRPPLADWEGLVGGATNLWMALHDAVGGDLLAPPVEGAVLVYPTWLPGMVGAASARRLCVLLWDCAAAWAFFAQAGGNVRVRRALRAHPRHGVQMLTVGFADPADLLTVAALANSAAQALLAAGLWRPAGASPALAAEAADGPPVLPPLPPAASRDRGRKRGRQ